jgi:hypothetical protein
VSARIYVEGGGHSREQRSRLRYAFRTLLEKAGLSDPSLVDVICVGPRSNAFADFCKSRKIDGSSVLLLIDSEAAVNQLPWLHVYQQDKWSKPKGAADDQLHLMVQIMENWFLCDRKMLADYFGKGFNDKHLPGTPNAVESAEKKRVLDGLQMATRLSQKGEYGKGAHSAELLSCLDPERLRRAAPHFEKLLAALSARLPQGKS